MRPITVVGILIILYAGVFAFWLVKQNSEARRQAPQVLVTNLVEANRTDIHTRPLKAKEILSDAKPIRVSRALKLPGNQDMVAGDYAIRDAKAFGDFLGKRNKSYIRSNRVDFSKQMALVVSQSFDSAGCIDSVVQTRDEIVVFVRKIERKPGMATSLADAPLGSGIVVNRTDLPVRFSWYDTN